MKWGVAWNTAFYYLRGLNYSDEQYLILAVAKAVNSKSKQDVELESTIKVLERAFESRSIKVRREKLCAGPAFKVKSGNCIFSGENFIFVDRRLAADQQLGVLLDYLAEAPFSLSSDELEKIPVRARETILARRRGAQEESLTDHLAPS